MTTIHESIQFLHDAEMGLGAWAWGDRVFWGYGQGYSDQDIEQAVDASLAAGVTLIDTAEVYGSGRSETLTGEFYRKAPNTIKVATKFFPYPWRFTSGSVVSALRSSLTRLKADRVDLYQLHWPGISPLIETYAEGLALAVKADLTRAVGVSNYDKNQMQRAYTILQKHDIPLASNQVRYNLLARKIEKNGLLARCQELGIRVIAYSPLAMGALTGKYDRKNPPPGVRGARFGSQIDALERMLRLMAEIGQDLGGKTPSQIAINWTICKGTLPIPGAKNALQAEMNAGAIGWRLTPEQVQALDAASDKLE
jgi:aryl-alcohol dehydrogenase-like predicted oxidoreductase